jgi:hypothetical protein
MTDRETPTYDGVIERTTDVGVIRFERPTLLEHTHVHAGSLMRWELEAVDTRCVLRASATSSPIHPPPSTTATSSGSMHHWPDSSH